MTIAEYLKTLDAAGDAEAKRLALNTTHIWSNEAAAGYAMSAALKAGLPTNQIRELTAAMKDELKTRTIERAEWLYKGTEGLYRG